MSKKIFVTGGAGYIGSHACVELLKQNHRILVYDNLSNSSEKAIKSVELIADRGVDFIFGDIRNQDQLNSAMCSFQPDTVLHFAGLKAVGESVSNPVSYYDVNVIGSINILKSMYQAGCNEIVFSSSATVYDNLEKPPYNEANATKPISPYGRTKLLCEMLFEDWTNSNLNNRAVILRYFNPIGAHESGLIGEDPKGIPNNLMPFISQVALRKLDFLSVFGDDYCTRDGTGERDFIHVVDLAMGHIKALESIDKLKKYHVLNLGTGKGTTVLELVKSFEKSNSVSIPLKIKQRRFGDVAISLADPTEALQLLEFRCVKTIEDMCIDTWHWQTKNPNGHGD